MEAAEDVAGKAIQREREPDTLLKLGMFAASMGVRSLDRVDPADLIRSSARSCRESFEESQAEIVSAVDA